MMHPNDVTTPDAAERYFDASIFGQLYMLMAAALGPTRKVVRTHSTSYDPAPRPIGARRESILDRLDRWFWRQEQKARDAYLAGSRDVFDLERRIEALERGEIARYY